MIITRQKPRLGELARDIIREPHSIPFPVGLWMFNEGGGTAVFDLSGNGHQGTFVGTAPSWTTGKYGSAVLLPGTDEGIITDPMDELQGGSWTQIISFFITTTKNQVLTAKRGSTKVWFLNITASDAIQVAVYESSSARISRTANNAVSLNTEHIVAWVYDRTDGKSKFYLDGILLSNDGSDTAADADWSSSDVYFGRLNSGSQALDGKLNWVYILNHVLTTSQVTELYQNPFPWFRRDPIEFWAAAQVAVGDDYVRTMDDNIGIGDVRTDAKTFSRLLTENLGVADASDRSATYPRTLAASLGLSDAFSKSLGYVRSEAETLGISDSMARSQIQARVIADDIGLLDLMQKGEIITFAENMGITDSMLRLIAYISNPSDTVGIADDMIRIALALRTVNNDMGLLDERTVKHISDLVKAAWAFMLMKKH